MSIAGFTRMGSFFETAAAAEAGDEGCRTWINHELPMGEHDGQPDHDQLENRSVLYADPAGLS